MLGTPLGIAMQRRSIVIGLSLAPLLGRIASAQTSRVPPGFSFPESTEQGAVIRGVAAPGTVVQLGSRVPPFEVHTDGHFIAGLSSSAPALVTVRWRFPGEQHWRSKELTVRAREYPKSVIDGVRRTAAGEIADSSGAVFGLYRGPDLYSSDTGEFAESEKYWRSSTSSLSAEESERIATEKAAKQAAFASRIVHSGFRDTFIAPVDSAVTSVWGAQRILRLKDGRTLPQKPHGGIDYRGITGAPVKAPAAGRVVLASADMYYEGGIAVIDHGQGLSTAYLHLSAVDCRVGDELVQGQVFCRIGDRGRATGPHLCWRAKWRGVDVDPGSLISNA